MTRLTTGLLAAVLLAAPATTVAAAPVAGSPATTTSVSTAGWCGISWGSLGKRAPQYTTGTVRDVRAGRHACFDRMVIDVARVPGTVGYHVRYVDQVRKDGSGQVVPLRGAAKLQVIARAPAYNTTGRATYVPADPRELADVSGYRTFRQLAWAGSFEGQSTVGVGVRARLPFRVFVLDGPGAGARLVVDVAHQW
ncbi:AMIN-like domain-containing (lipo)protein [Ornithinicoccus halotolerans]|uniref:AMIN-like domain-containing (lipo)protein n=1 Tax=Ornithinicoccus halotolerans TaxID=1748220 RepID=UPI001885F8C0|nr:hypothetical protein [Ornithinicoccus halotolerans]